MPGRIRATSAVSSAGTRPTTAWQAPGERRRMAADRAMNAAYTVGIDFGTASARALLVDVGSGREVATAVHEYENGVIDRQLPVSGAPVPLEADWALQDASDYVRAIQATVPAVVAQSG